MLLHSHPRKNCYSSHLNNNCSRRIFKYISLAQQWPTISSTVLKLNKILCEPCIHDLALPSYSCQSGTLFVFSISLKNLKFQTQQSGKSVTDNPARITHYNRLNAKEFLRTISARSLMNHLHFFLPHFK